MKKEALRGTRMSFGEKNDDTSTKCANCRSSNVRMDSVMMCKLVKERGGQTWNLIIHSFSHLSQRKVVRRLILLNNHLKRNIITALIGFRVKSPTSPRWLRR